MTNQQELEPCPFCGGSNLNFEHSHVMPDNYWGGHIHCSDCDATGGSPECWLSSEDEAKQETFKTWNTRTQQPATTSDGMETMNKEEIAEYLLRQANSCAQLYLSTAADPGFTPDNRPRDIILRYLITVWNQAMSEISSPQTGAAEVNDLIWTWDCSDGMSRTMQGRQDGKGNIIFDKVLKVEPSTSAVETVTSDGNCNCLCVCCKCFGNYGRGK